MNGVAEELSERLHEAEEAEEGEGELVVKSEGDVVYQASLWLQQGLQTSKFIQHFLLPLIELDNYLFKLLIEALFPVLLRYVTDDYEINTSSSQS